MQIKNTQKTKDTAKELTRTYIYGTLMSIFGFVATLTLEGIELKAMTLCTEIIGFLLVYMGTRIEQAVKDTGVRPREK